MIERQVKEKRAIHNSIPIRFVKIARKLGIGFFAAIITGIITGLMLRVIMKIIAMVFPHMERGFTFEGTFALVMVGVGFSLANSIIYMYIYRYLPRLWFSKGFIYGCINLCVYGIPFFLSNPDNDLLTSSSSRDYFIFHTFLNGRLSPSVSGKFVYKLGLSI